MQKEIFKRQASEYDRLLTEIAEEHDVDPDLVHEMIDYEKGRVHLERRPGAKSDLQNMIEQQLSDSTE
ncbi:DNA modification system-associated small protein [Salinibacter ruber]|uniref:DNA modification system-associated small protein n=1 Tax=Salinibacter ruber TaxID=146919 RepID=UPI0013C37A6F|nr:DNA modification system-associated small protein [Salinibacter ruber]